MTFEIQNSRVKTRYCGENLEVEYTHMIYSLRPQDPQHMLIVTERENGSRRKLLINEKQGAFRELNGEFTSVQELDAGLIKKLKIGLPKNISSKFPVLQ